MSSQTFNMIGRTEPRFADQRPQRNLNLQFTPQVVALGASCRNIIPWELLNKINRYVIYTRLEELFISLYDTARDFAVASQELVIVKSYAQSLRYNQLVRMLTIKGSRINSFLETCKEYVVDKTLHEAIQRRDLQKWGWTSGISEEYDNEIDELVSDILFDDTDEVVDL